MFSRRRVVALILTAVAAATVGYGLDGAHAAIPAADPAPAPTFTSASAKVVGGYWMLSADMLARIRRPA